jgi:hypothetical protein
LNADLELKRKGAQSVRKDRKEETSSRAFAGFPLAFFAVNVSLVKSQKSSHHFLGTASVLYVSA